jgi:uncharacterized protein (TIGR03435 family)
MKGAVAEVVSLIGLAIDVSFAQPAAERPAFEVASIRMYPAGEPSPAGGNNGIRVSPDGVAWPWARLEFCIGWAYDIPGRIFGPGWIHDRYDIVAKASGPVSTAQLRLMVQTLLEDRFRLKVHRELRELPVAVLIVAKGGPKNLQRAEAGDPLTTKLLIARWFSRDPCPALQPSLATARRTA